MDTEKKLVETNAQDKKCETESVEWETPEFVEQSVCAEICAYVFSAA